MKLIFLTKSSATLENIVSQNLELFDCCGALPIITEIESNFVNKKGVLITENLEFDEHKGHQFLKMKSLSHFNGFMYCAEIYHHNGNLREEVFFNDLGTAKNIHISNKKGNRIATFLIDNRGVRLFEKGTEVDPHGYEKYLFSDSWVNTIPDLLT